MIYMPKKSKKSQYLSILFIASGFAAMGLSAIIKSSGTVQIMAMVLIVTGIQLLVRFSLTDYRYIIDDKDDGSSDLIVCKRQGKKDVKVCHVSLSCVTDICRRSAKHPKADARYNYMQNPAGEEISITFLDKEKTCEIIIECDESFVSAIKSRTAVSGDVQTRFAM